MKSNFGKFFVLILLITFLSASSVSESLAQFVSDDPLRNGYTEGQFEIQSEIMAPAAGGSGIYTSSALEFWPYHPGVTFSRNGVGIYNTSEANSHFFTQLHLPHGVTIQQVVVYFYDNDNEFDLSAKLYYHRYTDIYANLISEFQSSGASTSIRYITAVPPAPYNYVDSVLREYVVQVLLPPSSSVILLSVRVDYSYTSSLPLIVN